MNRIKLIAILGLLLGSGTIYAQNVAFNGFCEKGSTTATTNGAASQTTLQGIVPGGNAGCLIHVYLTGTVTPATIYSDAAGHTLANPFRASISGQWLFFAAAGQGYDVQMSGGIAPNSYATPVTLTDLLVGTGGGGAGTVTNVSCGNLAPIFGCSVSNPTSTPNISFTLSNAQSFGFLGNVTGGSGPPSYTTLVAGSGITFTPNTGATPNTLTVSATATPITVQVNGTPVTGPTYNFVNGANITITNPSGGQIQIASTGGGGGCDTISDGGDCVSNDPNTDQVIIQPSGTQFGVEFPGVGGQPNKFELDQFGGNSFDTEFNQVTLYSNTRPMDIESANGGNISSYTHTLGDAQWAEFSWDVNNNTLMGAGESDTVGLAGNQPYPGWSIDAPGTLRVGSANGIVLESNSMGQSGMATTSSLVGGVQFPTAGTAQPIVIQGTLGFAQSYIATYNSGWTQTIDTGSKEPVTTTFNGFSSTNSTCGPSPCTWVQVVFQSPQPADEVPPFWSDCNLSTGCTGILPPGPPAGYLQPNFQAPFLLLTISGSTCLSGAANGTWPAYHRANTLNPSSGAYDFIIPGIALSNINCTNDHPVITFTPVLGGYGEQVQFIDGSAGPVTAKLIPADAPLNSGLTSSTNAGGLQTGYTSSLQIWVGRADSDTSNGITILPWAGDTINGASSFTLPASQYAVAHFISDGKHNWYVENGTSGGSGVTSLNSLTGALTVAASSPIVVTPSGGNTLTISCPTCGTSTASTVTVNGGSALGTANFNGTTPAASANGINVTWQVSTSNVSAEIVGDGNGTHFLSGLGTWITPAGAVSSVSNSDGTLTISPTTTAVIASLNLAHANSWSALQSFSAGVNLSGSTSPLQLGGSAGTSGNCLLSAGAGATPTWGTCGSGGSSAFSSITSGTNTTASMVVGSGASLAPTGTGTIQATNIASTISAGTNVTITGSGTTAAPYVINSSGGGGGGCTPGGVGSSVQVNNGSGGCTGDANFTYNATNAQITIAGANTLFSNQTLGIPGWNFGSPGTGTSTGADITQLYSFNSNIYGQGNHTIFGASSGIFASGNGDLNLFVANGYYAAAQIDGSAQGYTGYADQMYISSPFVYTANVISTGVPGSFPGITLTVSSFNNGSYGVGRWLIDKTTGVQSVTVTGAVMHGSGSNVYAAVSETGVSFTPSIQGSMQAGVNGPTVPNPNNTPILATFTVTIPSACSIGDQFTIGGVNTESAKIVNITSFTGGVMTATAWLRSSHESGAFFMCKGPTGRLFEQNADTTLAGGVRHLFTVLGAINATTLAVSREIPNGMDAAFINSSGIATIYPAARIVDARDPSSGNVGTGNLTLAETTATFTASDALEVPNGTTQTAQRLLYNLLNSNPYSGTTFEKIICNANSFDCGDLVGGQSMVLWQNNTPNSFYTIGGGRNVLKDMNQVSGPFGSFVHYVTSPVAPVIEFGVTGSNNILQIDDATAFWQWTKSSQTFTFSGNNFLFGAGGGGASSTAVGINGTLTLNSLTGSTQCLQVNSSGLISGTGLPCGSGSGAVNSISNSDGTLTISPTTGVVVASLTLSHANAWSAIQSFSAGINLSGTTSPLQLAGSAGTSGNCLLSAGTGATPTWGACGSGTVTDGAGTTTAGLISESTTTLHGIDYNSLLDNGHTTANTLTYSGTGGLALTGGSGHFITIAEQAAPANPASGSERIYADSTTHLLSCLTSTGASCMPSGGGGAVSSVSNSDGTLTISPTTGAVVASLNLGHANTWTVPITAPSFAGSGSTQTVINLTQGSAASSPPANTIQFGAPTTVSSSYNAYLPGSAPSDSAGDMWVVPSGGGTGSWKAYLPIQIAQVVIGASTSSVTFSSIPSTYTNLMVEFSGATDGANEDTPEFQFNGDTAAHYDQAGVFTGTGGGFTPGGFGQVAVTNFGVGGIIPVYNSSTPFAGNGSCTITNYTGPFYKAIHCESGGWQTTATMGQLVNTWGQWRGAAAITSITFFSGLTQNFHPGTTVTLYGLP